MFRIPRHMPEKLGKQIKKVLRLDEIHPKLQLTGVRSEHEGFLTPCPP